MAHFLRFAMAGHETGRGRCGTRSQQGLAGSRRASRDSPRFRTLDLGVPGRHRRRPTGLAAPRGIALMAGRVWVRVLTGIVVGLIVAVMTAWAAGAIYYGNLPGHRLRAALAIGFVAATVLAFAILPRRRRTLLGFLVAFALIVAWWMSITASNDRDWLPEVAVAPSAAIEGDRVTVPGVRNFDYRTETDFVARWEDRTYDLRDLDSADLIAVCWAGRAIAHIMMSFGFRPGQQLAVSIETRKAR